MTQHRKERQDKTKLDDVVQDGEGAGAGEEARRGFGGYICCSTFWLVASTVLYASISFCWSAVLGSLNMVTRWTRSAILTDGKE